jgi:YfiH family protein
MIRSPFAIFRPYEAIFGVAMLTKDDDIGGDDDVRRALDTDDLATAEQVHGSASAIVDAPEERKKTLDGLVTTTSNLTLAVRGADCQIFIAFDPETHVMGALHAGWRGLVRGAIGRWIATLTKAGAAPERLLIGAGPSLCKNCAEFTDLTKELLGIPERFFHDRRADLPAIADWQLMERGILQQHIERHPDCTKCNADTYWSYRGPDREAVQNGHVNILACVLR